MSEQETCPKCGAGRRSANSLFFYYLCGTYVGEQVHQSARCKACAEGRDPSDMTRSVCCGAELDCSHVIPGGPHKGHGPRYCSKCGKVVYIV